MGLLDQALLLILLSIHITRYFEIKELILEAFSVKRQGGSGLQGGDTRENIKVL